jgi:NAD(P)-dependent dehydrogenase (short-subunit alcohol dehydrogenase family)
MTDQKRYTNKLTNSRILVIGGTSGLGYSVAEACIENGALVTISSSNPSRIDAAVSQLKTAYPSAADPSNPRIRGLAVDLGKPETLEEELKTLLEKTVESMPERKLDHVVFTAGDKLADIKLGDMMGWFSYNFHALLPVLHTFPCVFLIYKFLGISISNNACRLTV